MREGTRVFGGGEGGTGVRSSTSLDPLAHGARLKWPLFFLRGSLSENSTAAAAAAAAAAAHRDVEDPDSNDEEHADEGAQLEARGVGPHVGQSKDGQLNPPLALLGLLLVAPLSR